MDYKETVRKRNRMLTWLAGAAVVYAITYAMALKEALLPFNSDMAVHIQYALSLDKVLELTHNGWHFIAWLLYACLPVDITVAAAAATALFNALMALVVLWLFERFLKPDYSRPQEALCLLLAVTAGLMAGPLYLRFYNVSYYLGQGTPNPWHNPTSIACRPLLLAVTVLTVAYWDAGPGETVRVGGKAWSKSPALQVALAILLAIGTLIKPSVLMVYGPACALRALYLLCKAKGRNFLKLLLGHLYLVPAAVIMLWQYISIYFTGQDAYLNSSGITIDPFYIAKLHAPSVLVSLLLKMAFPFLIIVIWRKKIFKDRLFILILLQYLTGLATTWIFRETGRRANHGNFGSGNLLASSLLWLFCLGFFIRAFREERKEGPAGRSVKRVAVYLLPGLLLFWHVLAGVCYYATLLSNMASLTDVRSFRAAVLPR